MITTLIIEDNSDSQEVLKLLLEQHFPQIKVLAQCLTAAEGEAAIARYKPDLVFLDVELGDKTAFELLSTLGEISFEIIFISGHVNHAAQAFRWSALDFLVKPITASLLQEAVEKAEKRRQLPGSTAQQLRLLLENVNSLQRARPLAKLALPTANDIEFVNIGDVIRIEGDKNYSTFYLNDKRKVMVSRTLGEYEKMLEDTTFMRIQKAHLVNLVYVKKYIKNDGGWILTADGAELPVSPLKRDALLEKLSFGVGV
jgi:two-component system, LytTR family, response regulator